jgi:hypothetical protein
MATFLGRERVTEGTADGDHTLRHPLPPEPWGL